MYNYTGKVPQDLEKVLDSLIDSGKRVRLFFGEDGLDWCEQYNVQGYIVADQFTAPEGVRSALLAAWTDTSRGPVILFPRLVKITVDKAVVWQHPNYRLPKLEIVPATPNRYSNYKFVIHKDGKAINAFRLEKKAELFISFLKGERNTW